MSGPLALHGGGEFLPGDEPFLEALLDLAAERPGRHGQTIRVAIVPTAAARNHPELAAAHGVAAFRRVGREAGLIVDAVAVRGGRCGQRRRCVDRRPTWPRRTSSTSRVAIPDLLPTVLADSAAWAAIRRAWDGGAVLAGASAGAMALATWTWTPFVGIAGLAVVPGLIVVPHADEARWADALDRFGDAAPPGLGALGLAERTGVISDDVTTDPITWRVVGPGEARWQAVRGGSTVVARGGETLHTPVRRR